MIVQGADAAAQADDEDAVEQAADGLTNYGTTVLNDAPCGAVATIAATGMGRSGTTMVSRVMDAAGIFMGTRLTPMSHEDKVIQQLIKNRDLTAFEAECRSRDARAEKWGFKVPALRSNLVACEAILRNPRFIVTFRDLLAIGLRNNMAVGTELIEGMRSALRGYGVLLDQVTAVKAPVLMISYEKALQYPERIVSEIARFSGIALDQQACRRIAQANVRNADGRYLGRR
jgi:hypothetical protein